MQINIIAALARCKCITTVPKPCPVLFGKQVCRQFQSGMFRSCVFGAAGRRTVDVEVYVVGLVDVAVRMPVIDPVLGRVEVARRNAVFSRALAGSRTALSTAVSSVHQSATSGTKRFPGSRVQRRRLLADRSSGSVYPTGCVCVCVCVCRTVCDVGLLRRKRIEFVRICSTCMKVSIYIIS